MTDTYHFDKIRAARNEFEALLRIYGISNRKLSRILGVSQVTSKRCMLNPLRLRVAHVKSLSNVIPLSMTDIMEVIEYDINNK